MIETLFPWSSFGSLDFCQGSLAGAKKMLILIVDEIIN